jgi:CrcB protein
MRHGVNLACARSFGAAYPWGTLMVNVAGSAAMGWLAVLLAERPGGREYGRAAVPRNWAARRLHNFSAFSLDALSLWQRGEGWRLSRLRRGFGGLSLAGLAAGLSLGRASA